MSQPHNFRTYKAIYHLFLKPFLSIPTRVQYFHLKSNTLYATLPPSLQDSPYVYEVATPKTDALHTFDPNSSFLPWREAFGGRRRCMRYLSSPEEYLNQYFSDCGVPSTAFIRLLSYPLCHVLPLFKKIKIWCHHHYDEFGSSVRYFVDLDALSGIPPPAIRSLGDDPKKWLTQLVFSKYDRHFWKRRFTETFGEFTTKLPTNLLSLKEFAQSPWLWVTPGATKFSKLVLNDKVIRTKFGAAVSLTKDEIWQHVLDAVKAHIPDREQIQVFVKPDEASFKRRLIANVPLGGYIIAAYIRYILEAFMGKEPKFMKLNVMPLETVDIINLLKQRRLALPLDESAYDYHFTRETWVGFFDFLNDMFPQNLGVSYFKYYFDHAYWIFENDRGRWLKGMPSGLALTTYLNSWANYIKQVEVVPSDVHWACGDDVLTFPFNQDTSLADVEAAYSDFGSEANASKNWSSYRFAEYLKVIYGIGGTSGYPARIFGSLLFSSNPVPSQPVEQLYEIMDLHKLYYDRLGVHFKEDRCVIDLVQAVCNKVKGFNKRLAHQWIHSPKIHGGYGKLPYSNLSFTWKYEDKEISEYKLSRIRLPKVIMPKGNLSLEVKPYHVNPNSVYHGGSPLVLPPIESEEDWIKRLNREDLPFKGPFSDLALDFVPLPVVDFISVANMSKLAMSNHFACAPNLHGNWNSISSRLIKGSILLAKFAFSWMDLQQIQSFV